MRTKRRSALVATLGVLAHTVHALPRSVHAESPEESHAEGNQVALESVAADGEQAPLALEVVVDFYGTVDQEIERACLRLGRADLIPTMKWLAHKESTRNPYAYNPHGPYYGLFQYIWPTWVYANRLIGHYHLDSDSVYDVRLQCEATAHLLAIGQGRHWGLR